MRESNERKRRKRLARRDEKPKKERKPKPDSTPEEAAAKTMGYVHPYAVVALFMTAFFLGFVFGWFVMKQPGLHGVAIIISICLIWAAKFPIKMWQQWAASRGANEEWVQNQLKKHMASEMKANAKLAITEDDFDSATRSLVIGAIKTARKQKTKVSVPFLLQELTKGIR